MSRLVRERALPLVALAVLAAWLGWRALLAPERFLDADELVHLNAAWFVSQGETMYVDFFENHPPLMSALLQPVVRSSHAPEPMIGRGRALMFALTLAILLATARLARRADGALAACIAAALLAGHTFFFQKTLEIRPDVPALLLFCLALGALARAAAAGSFRASLLAGALLCAAGLFTPKPIYAAAGACVAAALAAAALPARDVRRGARVAAGIALGGAGLAALACAELARRGMLAGFVDDAVAQSLRITIDDTGRYRSLYLATTLRLDALLWAAAVAGVWLARRRFAQADAGVLWILAGSFLGGALGLVWIDAPMRQMFLPLLPAAAVFAALALAAAARAAAARWGTSAAAAGLLALLLAGSVAPGVHLAALTPPMHEQLAILSKVTATSAPRERVFDCFSGLYLTRGHAWRYFYLNSDLIRLFAPDELAREIARALAAPDVKLVLADAECRHLPEAALQAIRSGFEPLADGGGRIWVRKPPRAEASAQPPPARE